MMLENNRVLVIEDDLNLGVLLLDLLEIEGYNAKLCSNGKAGLAWLNKNSADLCILDVMMPELDGYAVAKEIKSTKSDLPFLFLTAKSMKEDKLLGYSIGAEDYITKPFDEEELICKINVILRRKIKAPFKQDTFQIGQYFFDFTRQELTFNKSSHRLTEKESEVLRLLCINQNKILRRDEAVEKIYGKKDYFLGRSFDVFICRLRKLLSEDSSISIENVYKVGFILNISN